ncbi:hypothetical protein EPO05_02370 [Patescibacteria group bacterium]|nr:MAG: hypothetical protein EPO05_02370 [Patescibacteria group bacterium]
MRKAVGTTSVLLAVLVIFYITCVHYTDIHQVALVRNRATGELTLDSVPGFNLTPPWVAVARIDIRPTRVCITTTGRSFNCKLVQFVPQAYREFVATEGFRYYWLSNRISFNFGYGEEYRGMKDVLRGYAFGVERYPFVKVVNEYE